ncbi:N6-mAMP deaminase-like isoform X1 [Bidens hawaiensis]|uniref:N6-mAMP deaminase-like isoform X1 n=1 Tax=Bidens hawaiensis TaxID=980011 RepID=UPI00404A6C9C
MEEEWVCIVPKVELHAHLNGSIRNSTLLELARELAQKGTIVFSDFEHVIRKNDRTLREVFKLFDLIHVVTTDHKTITRITKEVVEDFAAENVVYLELRTTPKRNDSIGMSKRSYMEAVIDGLRSTSSSNLDINFSSDDFEKFSKFKTEKKIIVRLLLSIDRRESTASAMETVNLALEMKGMGVIGIDLSGNPTVGEWETFLPALKFAREQGLSVTLHCGEVPTSVEIQSMLDFLPGRIGHACCFEDEEWRKLKSYKIPVDLCSYIYFNDMFVYLAVFISIFFCIQVEICLTSNIRPETISSIDVHHFANLYKENHPIVLCTDDSGVFSTSLSNEYALVSSTFGLGKLELFELARKAVDFIFAGNDVKKELMKVYESAARTL